MDFNASFAKIIKKQVKYESTNLGLNLLISRLQLKYATDPSAEQLDKCLQEANAFFQKYSSILQKDLEAIKKL